MTSVALIGGDGAGKTTISHMLSARFPLPIKLLYMGINPDSTNVSLPVSRILAALRRRRGSHSQRLAEKADTRGAVWATLRMLNRLAEEWYRQLLSCWYEHRGYVVIYDRHYAFDFEYNPGRQLRLTERIHRWMLANHYPRPDLVLFLDAPPEVLYARKHEWGVPRLQARREALLRQGARTRDFVRIDAAQPLNAVYADVAAHIQTLCSTREVNRA